LVQDIIAIGDAEVFGKTVFGYDINLELVFDFYSFIFRKSLIQGLSYALCIVLQRKISHRTLPEFILGFLRIAINSMCHRVLLSLTLILKLTFL